MMKVAVLFLVIFSIVSCQKEYSSKTSVSVSTGTSVDDQTLNLEEDEACDTPELTEDKIVEQAMKPAKANDSGALQGATDCEVD
tara:strand:- start:830 stop:1081 length:252 start_codon:yes stop_codon:yes gene_type:complete